MIEEANPIGIANLLKSVQNNSYESKRWVKILCRLYWRLYWKYVYRLDNYIQRGGFYKTQNEFYRSLKL